MNKIEINQLNLWYGQFQALHDIVLDIPENEVTAFIGPSGCGKSTLIKRLNRMNDLVDHCQVKGEVLFNGTDIYRMSDPVSALRKKIGMVFQDYELFPHMDVLQNLTLAPVKALKRKKEEVQAEAETLLKRVGLEHKKHSYARELSGGQKQRVAIIRSLLMHPEILLFDEVTASLDPEMVREVLVLINDLAKDGRTMLIVTHEMEFARAIADRIIFMDKGEIIEENTVQNFFQHPQTQRAQAFLTTFDFNHF